MIFVGIKYRVVSLFTAKIQPDYAKSVRKSQFNSKNYSAICRGCLAEGGGKKSFKPSKFPPRLLKDVNMLKVNVFSMLQRMKNKSNKNFVIE